MKRVLPILLLCLLLTANQSRAQGTFVMDQYSSLDEYAPSAAGSLIDSMMPSGTGQSFTPSLSAIDYIRLNLNDPYPNSPTHNNWATLYLTLHANSMFGPVLGSTTPVFLANDTASIVPFLFSSTITLNAGTTYYFELVVQPGSDSWAIYGAGFGYPGGSVYQAGTPQLVSDLWFQEGIVVPEPTVLCIALIGAGALGWKRRLSRKE